MAAAHAAAASPTHRASVQATSTPPYPSAARIADSSCFPQYTASLKCLETSQDKSKCQQQFDNYKECKKKENISLQVQPSSYLLVLYGGVLHEARPDPLFADVASLSTTREARLERNRSRTLFG